MENEESLYNGKYIWKDEWIHPYESMWSICEKFRSVNVLTPSEFMKILNNAPHYNGERFLYQEFIYIKGSYGNPINSLISIPKNQFRNLSLNGQSVNQIKKLFPLQLKYCPKCMENCFHSYIHQFSFIEKCPWHPEEQLVFSTEEQYSLHPGSNLTYWEQKKMLDQRSIKMFWGRYIKDINPMVFAHRFDDISSIYVACHDRFEIENQNSYMKLSIEEKDYQIWYEELEGFIHGYLSPDHNKLETYIESYVLIKIMERYPTEIIKEYARILNEYRSARLFGRTALEEERQNMILNLADEELLAFLILRRDLCGTTSYAIDMMHYSLHSYSKTYSNEVKINLMYLLEMYRNLERRYRHDEKKRRTYPLCLYFHVLMDAIICILADYTNSVKKDRILFLTDNHNPPYPSYILLGKTDDSMIIYKKDSRDVKDL